MNDNFIEKNRPQGFYLVKYAVKMGEIKSKIFYISPTVQIILIN